MVTGDVDDGSRTTREQLARSDQRCEAGHLQSHQFVGQRPRAASRTLKRISLDSDGQEQYRRMRSRQKHMRVRLVGDNARYLARYWYECRLVDTSDDEEGVEFYPKPNSPGADALYDSYLIRLRAEAKGVGVALTIDDNTPLR
jgi:hypothetical protein